MEPYLGQISMFAGNYAPRYWAFCDGQLLAVSDNDALYSLLGASYGGDGRTNFGLPDLRGRVPVSSDTSPGLQAWPIGRRTGAESVELSLTEIPSHRHPMQADANADDSSDPQGRTLGVDADESYTETATSLCSLKGEAVASAGAGEPHDNMAPFLGINFIIALAGFYPTRQ